MRIAWYTPWFEESAIANGFGLPVLRQLRRLGHTVTVFRCDTRSDLPALKTRLRVRDAVSRRAEEEFDLCVYNTGDNYANHRYAVEHSFSWPGIIILHDSALVGLAYTLAGDPESFIQYYKAELAEEAFAALEDLAQTAYFGEFLRNEAYKSPLYQIAIRTFAGIVVHSEKHREMMENATGGPVVHIPLAYQPDIPRRRARPSTSTSHRLTIMTHGVINRLKLCHVVIRAIARSPNLRRSVRYDLAGYTEPAYANELRELAEQLGVRVRISETKLTDSELAARIDQAEIVLCLRDLANAGGSASTIEAMQHGKAVVVLNEGFFAGLPDECVLKVNRENMVSELSEALADLYNSPFRRARLADNARTFASTEFTAEQYVRKLLAFAEHVKPKQPILTAMDQMSELMGELGFLDRSTLESVAGAMVQIFDA